MNIFSHLMVKKCFLFLLLFWMNEESNDLRVIDTLIERKIKFMAHDTGNHHRKIFKEFFICFCLYYIQPFEYIIVKQLSVVIHLWIMMPSREKYCGKKFNRMEKNKWKSYDLCSSAIISVQPLHVPYATKLSQFWSIF